MSFEKMRNKVLKNRRIYSEKVYLKLRTDFNVICNVLS